MRDAIKQILKEYDKKRNQAHEEQKQRIREVYNVIPQIRQIDAQIQMLGLKYTKALLNSEERTQDVDSHINALKNQIQTLKKEKIELLQKYKYTPDFLDVDYGCSLCNDTGYIGSQKCKCFKQKLINMAYEQSNLSDILKKENFNTFDINLYPDKKYGNAPISPRENMKNIVSICEGFVNNFNVPNDENLLFYGSTGLGKTFLCNCIAKKLLDKGKTVVYLTAFNLFRILEEYRFNQNNQHTDRQTLDVILTCDLLIIDDIGTELSNTFTVSELFSIINTRLLQKRKTVISTNLKPHQLLETYSQRVFSRISGNYRKLEFYGPDLRWEK